MDLAAAPTSPFAPTGPHARLARLVGRWAGTAKTYLDPNDPSVAETASWEGTITMLLGGRFLRFVYCSQAMGKPLAGELPVAYEVGERLWRMSWIDSFHTGGAILVSTSAPAADTNGAPISAITTYFASEGQPRWGWRTELDDGPECALWIRMYNVEPAREETLAVAIELTRDEARPSA